MSILRYYIIDSLTFGGSIVPNSVDQQRIKKIYLLLLLQFLLYYLGSVLLFYFIIENWIAALVVAVLFTLIYFSISLVLLSGLRSSNYIKKEVKKNENKIVSIGRSALDVNEVIYENKKNKNELIAAVLLRTFFIIIFGFFIFIGLILGISLYSKPNLDEEHRTEILNDFKTKSGKETQIKIDLLQRQQRLLIKKRTIIEGNYKAATDSVKMAKDETHRVFFASDTAYYHKALSDWDFIHQNEMNSITASIEKLRGDFEYGYKKLEFLTAHRKFGIYRIMEFRNNNSFSFWMLFLVTAALFVLPYYIRFKMVLQNTSLDIELEKKIIAKIQKDYRLYKNELLPFHKKFGAEPIEEFTIDDGAPLYKKKKDDGEIAALKGQMNVFLNNEL